MIEAQAESKFPKYVNTLSSLPMFDQPKNLHKASYKTTYTQDFTKKVKYLDRSDNLRAAETLSYLNSRSYGKLNMEPSGYNVSSLTDRLRDRIKEKKSFKYDYNNLNELSDNSGFFTKSEYFDTTGRSKDRKTSNFENEPLSESHSSFRENFNYYKKPEIPSYIKKDAYFQSNAEKSLRFVRTHEGIMLPVTDDDANVRPKMSKNRNYGRQSTEDRAAYRSYELSDYLGKLGTDDDPKTALRTFYRDLKSESKDSFTPKPLTYRSQIVSNLQNDVYHTNSNKNIRFLRTSNGSTVPYVANQDELREEVEIKERAAAMADHPPVSDFRKSKHPGIDINKLDLSEFLGFGQQEANRRLKVGNPESQVKRNKSTLDKYFS